LEKGQSFSPDFHVPSIQNGGLTNSQGFVVKFDDVAVQQFGCMHKSKIAELKLLLQNSKPLKSNVADDLVQRELGLLLRDLN
jgi:hypothetical protein